MLNVLLRQLKAISSKRGKLWSLERSALAVIVMVQLRQQRDAVGVIHTRSLDFSRYLSSVIQ
jgi:hypothetical protein